MRRRGSVAAEPPQPPRGARTAGHPAHSAGQAVGPGAVDPAAAAPMLAYPAPDARRKVRNVPRADLLRHLVGVQEPLRIHHRFELPNQRQHMRRPRREKRRALVQPEAMIGRDRAAARASRAI